MSNTNTPFASIETEQLTNVSGGAQRVAAAAKSNELDSQLQTMLTSIGDSIKEVAKPQQDNSMLPMMMMMMMGGGGGGGAAPAAAAPPPPSGGTYVKVNVRR